MQSQIILKNHVTVSKKTSQLPGNERFRQTDTIRKSEVYLVAHTARSFVIGEEAVVVPPRPKGAPHLLVTKLFVLTVIPMDEPP